MLEFQDGLRYSESYAIMELLNDLYESKYDTLYPVDIYTKGRYREFIQLGSQIGLYMFRAILT